MPSVIYRQGCKEVTDTLTGASPFAFAHFLNNLEASIPARRKKGQPAEFLSGMQHMINQIRPQLTAQATDKVTKDKDE